MPIPVGAYTYSFISTAAVLTAVIKPTRGRVDGIEFFNISASAVFVKLYDMAGTPASTDTPVWRGAVPGNTAGAGFTVAIGMDGRRFLNGIGLRVTTGIADNDTGALTAATILGNIGYE